MGSPPAASPTTKPLTLPVQNTRAKLTESLDWGKHIHNKASTFTYKNLKFRQLLFKHTATKTLCDKC